MSGPRVAIVGSRSYADLSEVRAYMQELALRDGTTVIVSGGAPGVDGQAEDHAAFVGLTCVSIRPDYARWGSQRAPLERNTQIVLACDRLVAFWGPCDKCPTAIGCPHSGWSHGTGDVVRKAHRARKPVAVKRVGQAPTGEGW